MNNIVALPKQPFEEFRAASSRGALSFDFTFSLGIALTVIFPQIIFWYYFGVLAVVIFAVTILTGAGFGLGAYRNASNQVISCVPGASDQKLSTPDVELRLAA